MPGKTHSILLGGIAVGISVSLISLIPLIGSCLACLAYIVAGLLAVWHYTTTYSLTIPGGKGASMGALAGVVAAVVAQLVTFLLMAIGAAPSLPEAMRTALEGQNMDPAQTEELISMFTSPAFMVGMIIVGIIIASILGLIGGIIGASMFQRGGDTGKETLDTI